MNLDTLELILDETILDDTLTCCRCEQGAEYRVRSTCCGVGDVGCTEHEQAWEAQTRQVFLLASIFHTNPPCKQCGVEHVSFETAFRITPI